MSSQLDCKFLENKGLHVSKTSEFLISIRFPLFAGDQKSPANYFRQKGESASLTERCRDRASVGCDLIHELISYFYFSPLLLQDSSVLKKAFHSWWQVGGSSLNFHCAQVLQLPNKAWRVTSTIFGKGTGGISFTNINESGEDRMQGGKTISISHIHPSWKLSSYLLVGCLD